jgi:hypothetical protein
MSDNDTMVATTVKINSEHGQLTVFGQATLLVDGPQDPEGRIKLTLRHDSRSLFLWWNKYPDDTYGLDMWAPVPIRHAAASLPWMRATAYRFRIETNTHDRVTRTFLVTGYAEKDERSGEVLRFRQDATAPSSEESPGADR